MAREPERPPAGETTQGDTDRRPSRWRRWILRPLVWILVALLLSAGALLWVIQTDSVQDRLADFAIARAEAYIGRDIDVGEIRFGLLPLWIEVSDVVIPGPDVESPPVLTAERILVEADLAALWRSTLTLQRVDAEDLHLFIARDAAGELNLPDFPQRQKDGRRRLEVEIGTVEVDRSSFRLEERTVPLDLSARGVHATLLGVGDRELAGRAVVDEATVELPEAEAPLRAAVAGRIRIGRDRVEMRAVRVTAPDLHLTATGTVHWTGTEAVEIAVDGRVGDDLVRRLGYIDDQVDGVVEVDGSFTWQSGVWGFRGDVTSDRLRLVEWTLEEVSGDLIGDRNAVVVEIETARHAGGDVSGRVGVELDGAEEREVFVELDLDDVDLQGFLAAANIPIEQLGGRVTGDLSYRFTGSDWRRGEGWGRFEIEAAATRRRVPVAGTVPLTIADGGVTARGVRLTLPDQVVTGAAEYDLAAERGVIEYRIESSDLGPLTRLLPLEESDEPTLWLPGSGRGELAGTVRLDGEKVTTDLTLDLADAEAPGIAADRVEGDVRLSKQGVERLELEFERDGAAAIVTGTVPFETADWWVGLDIADWPLATAGPWLPFALPVDGPFTGRVSVRGVSATGGVDGEEGTAGEVSGSVAPAVVGGVEIDRLSTQLLWDSRRVTVSTLEAAAPAGAVTATGSLQLDSDQLDFRLHGRELALDRAPVTTVLGERLAGTATLEATVGGTIGSPEVDASLRARDLAVGGSEIAGDGRARLDLSWHGDELRVDGSLLGLVEVAGGGRLDRRRGEVVITVEVPDLGAVVDLFAADVPPVDGRASGELAIAGDIAEGTPDVTVTIDDLEARLEGREIVELEPIRIEFEPEIATIRSLYLGSPEGDDEIFVSGTVGLTGDQALDLNLQASFDNEWLDPYVPQVDVTGRTDVLASVGGDLAAPEANGQATVAEADLLVPALDQSFEELSAVLFLYPEAVVVDTMEAELGGGDVRASGRVDLTAPDETIAARMQMSARGVTVRYPEGWLLRGDADLVWSREEPEQQLIRGLVTLDRAYYLRDVEMGFVQLLQRFLRRQRLEVGETDEALADIELSVVVEAPDAVRVRNNLADLTGSADLTIRGTLARPVLFGEVEMDSGGELVYADSRYTVERAVLTFANPYRIEPVLDLQAVTEVAEYDISLNLSGTLDRLNASFSSDPPLPDVEVLSLLLSGSRATLSESVAGLEQRDESAAAAEGLLYGQAASLIGERVSTLFGFDAFRIEPLAAGGGTVSNARFTVGKRLSSDLFVTYSYDPTATEEERVQVEWQVSQGLVLVMTQRGDEYSVDLLWEERF